MFVQLVRINLYIPLSVFYASRLGKKKTKQKHLFDASNQYLLTVLYFNQNKSYWNPLFELTNTGKIKGKSNRILHKYHAVEIRTSWRQRKLVQKKWESGHIVVEAVMSHTEIKASGGIKENKRKQNVSLGDAFRAFPVPAPIQAVKVRKSAV